MRPGRSASTVEHPRADDQRKERPRGRVRLEPCIPASVWAAPVHTSRPDWLPVAPYFDCAPLSWGERRLGTWLQRSATVPVKTCSLPLFLFWYPHLRRVGKSTDVSFHSPKRLLAHTGASSAAGLRLLNSPLSDSGPFPPPVCVRSALQYHLDSCWWSLWKHAAFCWLCQTPTVRWGHCTLIVQHGEATMEDKVQQHHKEPRLYKRAEGRAEMML